jgi:hypothetical protein
VQIEVCEAKVMKSDIKIDNLRRWLRSGAARLWVDKHDAHWNHEDWLSLVAELEKSEFWPLPLSALGASLESVRAQYLTEGNIVSSAVPSNLISGLRWYLCGLLVVGFVAGFFAGLSQTPVVGVLLPLLFALVGGTGGLYLANANFDSTVGLHRMSLLGRALCAFSLACLAGAGGGIIVRVVPSHLSSNSESIGQAIGEEALKLKPDEVLQLLALRERLSLLGLSWEESKNVLKIAVGEINDATRAVSAEKMQITLSEANQLAEALQKTIAAEPNGGLNDGGITGLSNDLKAFVYKCAFWERSTTPHSKTAADIYIGFARSLLYSMNQFLEAIETSGKSWEDFHNLDRKMISDLYKNLHDVAERGDPIWKLTQTDLQELLIKIPHVAQKEKPTAMVGIPDPASIKDN